MRVRNRSFFVALAVGLVTFVVAFLFLDMAWATDHDLYGTAAEGKVVGAVLVGLVCGAVAGIAHQVRARHGRTSPG